MIVLWKRIFLIPATFLLLGANKFTRIIATECLQR